VIDLMKDLILNLFTQLKLKYKSLKILPKNNHNNKLDLDAFFLNKIQS
jgi:hypothetical protein